MITMYQHHNAEFDTAGVVGGTLGGWPVNGARPRVPATILLPLGFATSRSGDEMHS